MKKSILTIVSIFFTICAIFAQDVIYTVSGELNQNKVPLDSIVVENWTNNTSISFTDLPEHDYYQINLTKNAFWGTVSVFDIEESSVFNAQQNTPGLISVVYGGNEITNAQVSVININGQTVYRIDDLFISPYQSFQVKLGSEGAYFVKIETPKETKTFKAIGFGPQVEFAVEIQNAIITKSSENLKSTTILGEGDFMFEIGDSICIWAFSKDSYTWPKRFMIKESDDINFMFNDVIYRTKSLEAYPDSLGEKVEINLNGETLFCKKINGNYVFQGDILLSETQINKDTLKGAYVDWYSWREGKVKLWPDSKVYYEVSSELKNNEQIKKAIEYWNINTPVTFYKRNNETNYVEFVIDPDGGCHSNMGFQGGQQFISIQNWVTYGDILHEMGHTVGLIHEQSRSDRDENVKIHWENIEDGKEEWFNKFPKSLNKGPFDFNSIMIYNHDDFSKNKQSTITRLDLSIYTSQSSYLSYWDIKIIEELYGGTSSKKPDVSSGLIYNNSDFILTIIGNILTEGELSVTSCAIAWKKTGDSNYNHTYFEGNAEQFRHDISINESGEYLYYVSATNSFGTSTSEIGSIFINPQIETIINNANQELKII